MILVLNLKMNLTKDTIISYENFIHDKKVIVMPQYPYLLFFHRGEYLLGSQDVSKYAKGAYTGEVCAKGLKALGVKYCLVGHSERREYFNETNSDCKMKIQNTLDNNMIPIYCVTESKKDYFDDLELKSVEEQLEAIPEFTNYIIVAYEPSWLIGKSSINIDTEHINKVLVHIKNYLMERNINHSILYGGGINKDNIDNLLYLNCNDGFIISSSALDLEELGIIYSKVTDK